MDSKHVFGLLRTTISESFYADSSPRYYFAIVESEAGPVLHFRPFIPSRKNRLRISSQWYWIRWLWNLLATFVFIEFRCFSFVHFSERTRSLRCYFASPILFADLCIIFLTRSCHKSQMCSIFVNFAVRASQGILRR